MADDPIEEIGARLAGFLGFMRPVIVSDPALDRALMKRHRNLTDLRLSDEAIARPRLSIVELCELAAYKADAPRFCSLALDHRLLTAEQLALPIPHNHVRMGMAINAVLLQNVYPADRLRALMIEFVLKLESAPKPQAPKPIDAVETAAQIKLPPRVAQLLGDVEGLWVVPPEVSALRAGGTPPAELAVWIRRLQEAGSGILTAGLMQRLCHKSEGAGDPKSFWGHSLWVAHASRLVCLERSMGDGAEFFAAGLLHDIGRWVVGRYLPAKQAEVDAAIGGGMPAAMAERRLLGINHAAIGACLAERWVQPPAVVEAAGHHLDELALLESVDIPMASKVAGTLCGLHRGRTEAVAAARFFKIARPTLEELTAKAQAAAAASLKDWFQIG